MVPFNCFLGLGPCINGSPELKLKTYSSPFSQVLWSIFYSFFSQTLLKIYETFVKETHHPLPKLKVALVAYQQPEGNNAEEN